jgi:hypothetical protein
MLCCVGLFAGAILGGAAGIPWLPYVTMPLGAASGLLADIKIFRTLEKKNEPNEEPQKEQDTNQFCCASIFNLMNKKKKQTPVVVSEN